MNRIAVSMNDNMSYCEFVTYKNVTISHFIFPLLSSLYAPCVCPFSCCVMPILSWLLFLIHTWVEGSLHSGNHTTWLHSSGKPVSQALSLLSEYQEPEVVSHRYDYVFYTNRKILQSIKLFLSSFHHLHWFGEMLLYKKILLQKSLFAISHFNEIFLESRWKVEKER